MTANKLHALVDSGTVTAIETADITADAIDDTLIADEAVNTEHLNTTALNGLTTKATPVVADSVAIVDSEAANINKKATVTTIKAAMDGVGQVAFPATQNPSADANTLDDYEEGQWTPDLSFSGDKTGITYSVQTGHYTKIGNLVTVWCQFTLTSKGSDTGNAQIAGLPFNVGVYSSLSAPRFQNISFADQFTGLLNVATDYILLYETAAAGTQTTITDANFANNSSMIFSATYRV